MLSKYLLSDWINELTGRRIAFRIAYPLTCKVKEKDFAAMNLLQHKDSRG